MADDSNTSEPGGGADGVLSQADIDAALAGGGQAGDTPAAETSAPSPNDAPADEAVGQDDIDALMNAAGDAGGAGDLTQTDIDAALAGSAAGAGGGDSGSGADQGGGLTQADIDAALAGGASALQGEVGAEAPAEADTRVDMSGRPFDDAAAAMAAAIAEEQAVATTAEAPQTTPLDLPDLGEPDSERVGNSEIDLLHDVSLRVKIELGRTRMMVEDVLRLGDGSVIELDRLAGDPVDVFANDRLVARGEVLVLNDTFCVRVSEIISAEAATAEA